MTDKTAKLQLASGDLSYDRLRKEAQQLYLRNTEKPARMRLLKLLPELVAASEQLLRMDTQNTDRTVFARNAYTFSLVLKWASELETEKSAKDTFQLAMRLCVEALELEEDHPRQGQPIWLCLRILSARLWMQKGTLPQNMVRYLFKELAEVACRVEMVSDRGSRQDILTQLAGAYIALARMPL